MNDNFLIKRGHFTPLAILFMILLPLVTALICICLGRMNVPVGDVIAVRKMQVTYSYRVLDLVSSRQPAKNVPLYCLNITPQEELDKLSIPRETIFVFRDRGTGRPTKKERRELDGLMDGIYYDGDE